MNRDWMASFEALRDVYIKGAYSNIAVNEAISRHKGCRDSFVRNMVKGVLRHSITIDAVIDRLARKGSGSIKQRTKIILRMGIYAIDDLDSVPDYAAVNEAVALARLASKGNDRFVNAVLRNYIREKDSLRPEILAEECSDADERLGLLYSFKPSTVRLIRSQYGEETEKILKGMNSQPLLTLRVNTLKNTKSELISLLNEEGFILKDFPADKDHNENAPAARALERAVIAEGSGLLSSGAYHEGRFSVQSLTSMEAIEALSPKRGDRVLDMCAAPGGKSMMMAEMMDNTGSITSCDIHEHRLGLIQASAVRLGISIVSTELSDAAIHDASREGAYDRVLADVPCSGLGVISSKPEIRLRTDYEEYESLTEIQREILMNAVSYARPGGRICYSTCTINRSENEDVAASVLQSVRFVRIVEMRTILPYNNSNGFFYCILEKLPL